MIAEPISRVDYVVVRTGYDEQSARWLLRSCGDDPLVAVSVWAIACQSGYSPLTVANALVDIIAGNAPGAS